MDFAAWLTANGYDGETLNKPENATQRKHLDAAWKAETQPPASPIAPPANDPGDWDTTTASVMAKAKRTEELRKIATEYLDKNSSNSEKVKELTELTAKAVEAQVD